MTFFSYVKKILNGFQIELVLCSVFALLIKRYLSENKAYPHAPD